MMNLLSNIHCIDKLFSGSMSFLAEQNTFETIVTAITNFMQDKLIPIFNLLTSLVLIVCKWALTFVDYCFILIRQIGGLNVDYTKPENMVQDDIIFQFITNENIKEILKGLLIFAVVVILIMGIIAIIKSEFSAIADSVDSTEVKNDKSKIWKNIFQSLFLLIFVPIVFMGGLIMSNAVLQTILNGITGAENMTISSQIFVASTYSANAYRNYADGNQKIPITYQFNQIRDYSAITQWDTDGTTKEIQEALVAYKQADEWTQGYATYEMFSQNTYFDMDSIDKIQLTGTGNTYNDVYDYNIRTYKYEYYVNADLQDYLMRYGTEIYFKTVEEAYKTCESAGVILSGITTGGGYYKFTVDYVDGREKLEYQHKIGATDESDGAVFLACLKKEITQSTTTGTTTKTYYEPITMNNSKFDTDYLENGDQYVVARGFFDDGIYPTAIKSDKGKISFYRDKLNIPTFGSFFPHISYELPEGTHEASGVKVIKSAIQLFTGVDVSEFLPYVYFDIDFNTLYSKITRAVTTLDSGGYYLDYSFTSDGVDIGHIYQQVNINYPVLVLATTIILTSVTKAFFGLIKRSVDIMFLYLIYPTAISTMPLYGNKSFGEWVKKMTNKVLSLYGLMIGINLALVMIPICASVEIFTPQDLQNTVLSVAPNLSAKFMNYVFQVLFTLVGINMIFKLSSIIQGFVINGDGKKADDIIEDGDAVISGTKELYKKSFEKVSNVVTGKVLVDSVHSVTGYTDKDGQYHGGWIPGSAGKDLVNKWKETKYGFDKNAEKTQEAKNNNKEQIQNALAEAKQKKQNKKQNNKNNTNKGNNKNSGGNSNP